MQENANHRSYTPSRFGHQLKTLERRQQGTKDHMPKEFPQYCQNPPQKQASTSLIQFGAPVVGRKGTNTQTAADKKSYATEHIHKHTHKKARLTCTPTTLLKLQSGTMVSSSKASKARFIYINCLRDGKNCVSLMASLYSTPANSR